MNNLSKFSQKGIILLLILIAFAPILHKFIGFSFAGFSLFVTVIPAFILIFLYIFNFKCFNKIHHFFFIVNLLFFFLLILLRSFFYDEVSFRSLGGESYVFLIPICIILFNKFQINQASKNFIFYLLTIILIFNFSIAILLILGLPTLQIQDINNTDYIEFSRFSGIMGGANVQGNFVLVIFMILVLCPFNLNLFKIFLLFVLSFIAVVPTLSKNSIIGIILIFIYSIYVHYKTSRIFSKFFLLFVSFSIVLVLLYWIDLSSFMIYFESFVGRLSTDDISGGRLEKLYFAFSNLFSNFSHMAIGIPSTIQLNSFISISDNSLTLLFACFGIPYTIFFCLFIVFLIKYKIKINKKIALYTLLTIVILLTNNAVLWLPWVIYTILGYSLLSTNNNIIQPV